MPLWFFPSLMGILATLSLLAAIWLVIHLRDVASLFSSDTSSDIVRGPGRRRASRARVWFVLFIFNTGWIASLLIWIFVIGGYANAVTDAAG
ncbi:hypothetical protein [Sphingopyxis sp.]|jgi:hypothetical protein|uniref:hypothetical protein n=1 Tax=Sphingopyxis sp. TaxID=1908224 RepID=UPI002DF9E6A3|nr:hypothetical protein [Sphingopyxis sp.]